MFVIQSLGGVRIHNSSGDTIRLRSRKHLALLVYLAASGRRVYTRDSLARLLWETSLDRARHSLSQAIYDLRRNLVECRSWACPCTQITGKPIHKLIVIC